MKISKKFLLGTAALGAITLLPNAAQAGISNDDFNNSFKDNGGKTDGGGDNGGGVLNGGGSDAITNLNNSANSLANPVSTSTNNGSFVNLGGTSIGLNQDSYYSTVRIGAASCPKPNFSLVASGNGIWQDSDVSGSNSNNAYGFSGAAVFSMPLSGKDGRRCSEYLKLQVDDLYYSQGLKSSKACVALAKEGVSYFEPTLYGKRVAAICNSIAMQIGRPKQVEIREVIKEVPKIIEVPTYIPTPKPVPPTGQKNG